MPHGHTQLSADPRDSRGTVSLVISWSVTQNEIGMPCRGLVMRIALAV